MREPLRRFVPGSPSPTRTGRVRKWQLELRLIGKGSFPHCDNVLLSSRMMMTTLLSPGFRPSAFPAFAFLATAAFVIFGPSDRLPTPRRRRRCLRLRGTNNGGGGAPFGAAPSSFSCRSPYYRDLGVQFNSIHFCPKFCRKIDPKRAQIWPEKSSKLA